MGDAGICNYKKDPNIRTLLHVDLRFIYLIPASKLFLCLFPPSFPLRLNKCMIWVWLRIDGSWKCPKATISTYKSFCVLHPAFLSFGRRHHLTYTSAYMHNDTGRLQPCFVLGFFSIGFHHSAFAGPPRDTQWLQCGWVCVSNLICLKHAPLTGKELCFQLNQACVVKMQSSPLLSLSIVRRV